MQSLAIAIAAILGISVALIPVLIGLTIEHHDRRDARTSTRTKYREVTPVEERTLEAA